jgi:hypothetical protein
MAGELAGDGATGGALDLQHADRAICMLHKAVRAGPKPSQSRVDVEASLNKGRSLSSSCQKSFCCRCL